MLVPLLEEAVKRIPKNFFAVPFDSITSTRPGRIASMDGTWLARMPMSPVSAGMFTCVTSADVYKG